MQRQHSVERLSRQVYRRQVHEPFLTSRHIQVMTMLLGCVVVSSLLFAPTTPRRHPGARACASDAPTSSVPPEEPSGKPSDDSISSVPLDMPMEGARSMRIDQRSMDNEQELWDKPVATREEMASVIPDWAAGLMLEGERRDEYESERADEQAAPSTGGQG